MALPSGRTARPTLLLTIGDRQMACPLPVDTTRKPQRWAQAKFPGMHIGVHKLDDKRLAGQARVYSNATIVLQSHGAALGNAPALT